MIVSVIPLKRLREAKSRLAPGLPPHERAELALQLLNRVIDALADSGVIDRIAIVTPELELRLGYDVTILPDAGNLNASLERGVDWALSLGAETLLILPADLPLVRPSDVRALTTPLTGAPAVSLVRTQDGGTGALLLSPPGVIPPSFGTHSFHAHVSAAASRDVRVHERSIDGLAHDLDTLDDLERARLLDAV